MKTFFWSSPNFGPKTGQNLSEEFFFVFIILKFPAPPLSPSKILRTLMIELTHDHKLERVFGSLYFSWWSFAKTFLTIYNQFRSPQMLLPGAYSQEFAMERGLIPGVRARAGVVFHIKQFFAILLQIT